MRILYLEDNEFDVELTRRELPRAIPNLELTVANTVAAARRYLDAAAPPRPPYDIILSDLRLPDGSGLDFLHYVRERAIPTAVVILTGQGDEEIAVAALKAGADDYMPKRDGYHRRLPDVALAALERFQRETTRKTGLLRVLYAEHDAVSIERTHRHLTAHAPHIRLEVVLSAADLRRRLPAAPASPAPWDAILLDFNLPGENALDLIKHLHDERRLSAPVVLVTAQGDEEIAAQALRLGASDYLVKHAGYLYELPVALENAHVRAQLAREQAALRASEARFRRLAENAPDLIYRYALAPEPRFEYVSPAAFAVTGYTPEDHYADPLLGYKLVLPEDRPLLEQSTSSMADYGQPLTMRWVRKDGSVIWTEQRNVPIYDGQGKLVAIEGIARDITRRKLAEVALAERLGELEALHTVSAALRTAQTQDDASGILLDETLRALEIDAGCIWVRDESNTHLRLVAVRGWCHVLTTATFAAGAGITGTVFATGIPYMAPEIATDQRASATLRSVTPPGWSGAWTPIRTNEEIAGVLFVALPPPRRLAPDQLKLLSSLADLAGSFLQRLQLLQQAQEQAQLTRRIIETVPEGLVLLDANSCILLANPAATAMLATLGGATVGDILPGLGDLPIDRLLQPPAQGPWHEFTYAGAIYAVSAHRMDRDSPASRWLLVIEDVTQAREHQRYQEVQDRLATVGQLAAGIAHDFNNVLGVISVYGDILQSAPNLNEKQHRQVATIVDQVHHAANLVRQVLDFSRRAVMERSHIDLFPLVNEQVKLLHRTLPETITVELAADARHYIVHADPTRIRQVIMNLAVNARDAMPNGGRLRLDLSTISLPAGGPASLSQPTAPLPDMDAGPWLQLTVADTGTGIAPAHLPHVFEPFFTTKQPGQGTGLGLAQVYGIIKQHGGHIDVASMTGRGATFTIYLPLAAATATAEPGVTDHELPGGHETILLVEDNADLLAALEQTLSGLGYQVLAATNGYHALDLAAHSDQPVDLLLSDMVMPGMSGLDLFTALHPLHPTARLLIMSGHPVKEPEASVLERNAVQWVQKPFLLSHLAARVRTLLDSAP